MARSDLRSALRDTLVLVVIATILGYLTTPHNPFFTGLSLHPYLLVTLLMAARYGTGAGVGTAIVLVGLYAAGGLARESWQAGIPSLFTAPHSVVTSGLLLTAVVVGTLFDGLHDRVLAAERSVADGTERLRVVQTHNEVLETSNRELRARIMEETTTFQSLYEMAEKLSTLEPLYLYPAVLEILEQHLGAERCSFYAVEGDHLRLTAQRGWESVPAEARRVPIDEGVLGRIVREKQPITLKDQLLGDEARPGEKLMAAPVFTPGTREVMGVIAIERIPFERFTPQNVRAFRLIAEWTTRAVANVDLFDKVEEERARLYTRAESEAMDRQYILSRMIKQLDERSPPEALLHQIASLGERILPRLKDALVEPTLNLSRKANVLAVLERLNERSHRLPAEAYRTFVMEGLRDWYRLEHYRRASNRFGVTGATQVLQGYIEGRQDQLRIQIKRGLKLLLTAEHPEVRNVSKAIRVGEVEVEPLVLELFGPVQSREERQIARILKTRWSRGEAAFEDILEELVASPDPWLRSGALHALGMGRCQERREMILSTLGDEDPLVRETALIALARLGHQSRDPELITALRRRSVEEHVPQIRHLAGAVLARVETGGSSN